MYLRSILHIRHPASQSVGAGKPIHKWPETHALHYTANLEGVRSCHDCLPLTTQLRPCHPTWTTLPSCTSRGTAYGAEANAHMRECASRSSSTSNSVNSKPFHSSHSRISRV